MDECVKFTEGDFYSQHFNARSYLETFYACPRGHSDENDFLVFVLRCLSETFSTGNFRGQRLIEIGSGPTIHSLISACEYFEELVLSDFTESNREEVGKWLTKEDGYFDWNPVIQHVCEMEERRSPLEVEVMLRQKVKQVLKCDVRLDNPFHPLTIEPADCVVTSLCLESACKDINSYRCALRSVALLLRPGGALVMIGVLGETFYLVAGQRFSCLRLSRSHVEDTLKDLGFSILEFNLLPAQDQESNSVSDFEAFFHLVALRSPINDN